MGGLLKTFYHIISNIANLTRATYLHVQELLLIRNPPGRDMSIKTYKSPCPSNSLFSKTLSQQVSRSYRGFDGLRRADMSFNSVSIS